MAFDPNNYGSAMMNLDRELKTGQKQAMAWRSPANYLDQRNKAIEALQKKAREVFKQSYDDFIREQFSPALAKSKAEEKTQVIMAIAIQEFNVEWPEDINKIAASLVAQKGSSNRL